MTIRVMLNMYINNWVMNNKQELRGNKTVTVEEIAINPSAERVVTALINKLGLNVQPDKWKKEWILDVNAVEDKTYDVNMSMGDFVWVLHKEGVITIIEDKPVKPKEEIEEILETPIESKPENTIELEPNIVTRNIDKTPILIDKNIPIEEPKETKTEPKTKRQLTLL